MTKASPLENSNGLSACLIVQVIARLSGEAGFTHKLRRSEYCVEGTLVSGYGPVAAEYLSVLNALFPIPKPPCRARNYTVSSKCGPEIMW